MPEYVVKRIRKITKKGSLKKVNVLMLGVAYKKNVKDLRKSPALDIIEILKKKGAAVKYHDPYIPYLKIGSINDRSIKLTKTVLRRFDCAVLTCAHSNVDYETVIKHSRKILDTRNALKSVKKNREKIEKL
jgi:UDP-N-acetyl-D-glucosamine dehydrogenase